MPSDQLYRRDRMCQEFEKSVSAGIRRRISETENRVALEDSEAIHSMVYGTTERGSEGREVEAYFQIYDMIPSALFAAGVQRGLDQCENVHQACLWLWGPSLPQAEGDDKVLLSCLRCFFRDIFVICWDERNLTALELCRPRIAAQPLSQGRLRPKEFLDHCSEGLDI